MPSWVELLRELETQLAPHLKKPHADACRRLLRPGSPEDPVDSRTLITAATLLRSVDPNRFDRVFQRLVTAEPGCFSDAHNVLLDLQPRGIMTFNYDEAHESSCKKRGLAYRLLVPHDDQGFVTTLKNRLVDFFILKAHGSTSDHGPLVLTSQEYRNILVKNPAYRGFVQTLFTNYSFLIVGFGMDDPDFSVFLDGLVEQYGSPVHNHIVIRHQSERSRRDVVLRERYGIRTLSVRDWTDIPMILQDACRTPGPELLRTVKRCLSPVQRTRVAGHRELRRLGDAGRTVVTAHFKSMIDSARSEQRGFRLAEVAYCLGVIDPKANRDTLIEIVTSARHVEPPARALTVLRPALTESDLPLLRELRKDLPKRRLRGKGKKRLQTYLDYLIEYIPAKFSSDPRNPSG